MANRRMKKWVSLALSIFIVLTSVPVNRVHADGVPKAESDTSITVGTNADDQSAGFEQTSEDEIPDASETPAETTQSLEEKTDETAQVVTEIPGTEENVNDEEPDLPPVVLDEPMPERSDLVHGIAIPNEDDENAVNAAVTAESGPQPQLRSMTPDGNVELRFYFAAGAEDRNGRLVKSVDSPDPGQRVSYQVYVNFNRDTYQSYEKGDICLTIPKSIFFHMDEQDGHYDKTKARVRDTDMTYAAGEFSQTFYPTFLIEGNVVTDGPSEDAVWYYESDDENIYVRNNSVLDSQTLQFRLVYQTTLETYAYFDYTPNNSSYLNKGSSLSPQARLEATGSGGSYTLTSTAQPVWLDTNVGLLKIEKKLSQEYQVDNWQYLIFEINADLTSKGVSQRPTQLYDLVLKDDESRYTGALADDTGDGNSDHDYELVGYYTGTKASTDVDDYTIPNETDRSITVPFLTGTEKTIYVMIRVGRDPSSSNLNYHLKNEAYFTLRPYFDGGTITIPTAEWEDSFLNTSPHGQFMIHVWGNVNWDSGHHNRVDLYGKYRNNARTWGHMTANLSQFISNPQEITTLPGLRFWTWFESRPGLVNTTGVLPTYSYIFADMNINTEDDTDGSVLNDTGVNVHNRPKGSEAMSTGMLPSAPHDANKKSLDPADYCLSELFFYPEAQNATWNSEDSLWVVNRDEAHDPFANDEPIIVEARFGSRNADWVQVAAVKYHKKNGQSMSEAQYDIVSYDSSLVTVMTGEYEGETTTTPFNKDYGFKIVFNGTDCINYRIRHTNSHYAYMIIARANYSLKSSQWMLSYLRSAYTGSGGSDLARYMYLMHISDMRVFNAQGDKIFDFDDLKDDEKQKKHLANRISASAAVGNNQRMTMVKDSTDLQYDGEDHLVRVSWYMGTHRAVDTGVNNVGTTYSAIPHKYTKGGIFFDVIPRGSTFDIDSLKVYGVDIQSGYKDFHDNPTEDGAVEIETKYLLKKDVDYTVEIIDDSNNTYGYDLNGLTMVIIRLTSPSLALDEDGTLRKYMKIGTGYWYVHSGYSATYDTVTYYEDLDRYGDWMYNAAAFESLEGIKMQEHGYYDNPRNKGVRNENSALIDGEGDDQHKGIPKSFYDRENILDALTNLEPKNDQPYFNYDFAAREAIYTASSSSGLSKRVVKGGSTVLARKIIVDAGGTYRYRLRYATDSETTVTDLILYDKLESAVVNENGTQKTSEWHGTVTGLEFKASGTYEGTPTYYYVDDPTLTDNDIVDADHNIDLTDTAVWHKVTEATTAEDLAKALWVAVKAPDDYVMRPYGEAFLWVDMKAPSTNETVHVLPPAYNDTHVLGVQDSASKARDGLDSGAFTNISNPTEVRYRVTGEIRIEKRDQSGAPMEGVTFRLTGDAMVEGPDGQPTPLLDENEQPVKIDLSATTDAEGHAVITGIDICPAGDGLLLTEVVPDDYMCEGENPWTVYVDTAGVATINDTNVSTAYFTVVNHEATHFSGWKKWENADGSADAPAGATVIFELLADGEQTGLEVELDGTADEVLNTTGGYESEPWKASFVHLEKYKADGITEIVYSIREKEEYPGYHSDTMVITEDGGVIVNATEYVELRVWKLWKNANGTTTPPTNAKVTLTLLADGTDTGYSVVLNGYTTAPPASGKGGYAIGDWEACFIGFPKYRPGTTEPVVYTVVEKEGDGWPCYVARYIDKDGNTVDSENVALTSAPDHGTILNEQETVSVYADKKWLNYDGTENPPPGAKVVFTLVYRTSSGFSYVLNSENTITRVTLDGTVDEVPVGTGGYESEPWRATFVNLPKYRPGTTEEYAYLIFESTSFSGYEMVVDDPAEMATTTTYVFVEPSGVITNKQKAGFERSFTKIWVNADGRPGYPEGAEVEFTLYVNGSTPFLDQNGNQVTVRLDGVADTDVPTTVGGYESEPWVATFVNLPEYDYSTGRSVRYTGFLVLETSGWPGYTTPTYAGLYSIENSEITTSFTGSKYWKKAGGNSYNKTDYPEGAKVTFRVLADGVPFVYYVDDVPVELVYELDGVADTYSYTGLPYAYEYSPWTVSFSHLPKYRVEGGELVEISYTVEETVGWPGYDVSYVNNHRTVYNTEADVDLYADKTWIRADGSSTPPNGATVRFTLLIEGEESDYYVDLDGKADVGINPNVKGSYESAPWRASFRHFPKYKLVGDELVEIDYKIKETVTYEGFTVEGADTVATEGTITNKEETVEIDAVKAWKNLDGTTAPPEGAAVTFTLVKNGAETNISVALTGAAAEVPDSPAPGGYGYEIEAWKAHFTELPKYTFATNGTRTENTYTVKETVEWPGYVPDQPAAGVGNNGVITNEEAPVEVTAEKVWRMLDPRAVAPPRGAQIEVTLFADGEPVPGCTVVLDGRADAIPTGTAPVGYENMSWKVEFINLPAMKHENGADTPIKYTIRETKTWPGYAVSYSNGGKPVDEAESGGRITNAEESVKIVVTKLWKTADGRNEAPKGATVTLDLYADGVKTRYSVTLDGKGMPTIVVGPSGYESDSWVASFENMPKYRIENGEAVEIVYTVKEAENGGWPGFTVTYLDGKEETAENGAPAGGYVLNEEIETTAIARKVWLGNTATLPGAVVQTPPKGAEVGTILLADGQRLDKFKLTGEVTSVPDVPGRVAYESAPWEVTFLHLPKYRIENGEAVEIEYSFIEDTIIEGYSLFGNIVKNDDGTFTITNKQNETDISVTKEWKSMRGTPPENAEVTFTLFVNGNETGYSVTLKGTTGTDPGDEPGGWESEPWTATFVNMPEYIYDADGNATECVYTVQETKGWPGFRINNASAEDGGKITNEELAVDIFVQKNWKSANGSTNAPADAVVTLELFADGVSTGCTLVLNGERDAAPTDPFSAYEKGEWFAAFVGWPKFKNDNGTEAEIKYTVVEKEGWPGFTVSYADENGDPLNDGAVNGGTILNEEEETELIIRKIWIGNTADLPGAVVQVPPKGAYVDIDLMLDGQLCLRQQMDGEADADGKPAVTGAWEADAWELQFVHLPKYRIENGEAVLNEYTVVEKKVMPEGYSMFGNIVENADGSFTVTNKQNETSISAKKEWKNANGETVPPEGAKVTFTLFLNGTETGFKVELSGSVGTDPGDEPGAWESAAWTATFANLPEYIYDADGNATKCEYTVKETVKWPGYETETDTASDGGTILNEQEVTQVDVEKIWDDDDDRDGYRPAKIVVNLFADGVKVAEAEIEADENGDWKYSFTNLPKIDSTTGEEIEYTITEEKVENYEEPVIKGYTITNKHVPETVEIPVKKTWDDGKTEVLHNENVTIHLYADGADTGLTLVLNKDNDWEDSFRGLNKYKEGKAIKYTIVEDEVEGYTTNIVENEDGSFSVVNVTNTPPPTGDASMLGVWAGVFGTSGAGLVFLPLAARRRRKEEDEEDGEE